MSRDPFLPCPPQMSNGGSPPAHSSLSSDALFDPSVWLKIKWSQPPPRAPEWVIVKWYVPPADPDYGDWFARARCEDRQDAGLLPLPPPRQEGPLARLDRHTADIQYRAWKRIVDDLWGMARLEACVAETRSWFDWRRPWQDNHAAYLAATTTVDELDADWQEMSPLPSMEASPSPHPTSSLSTVLSTSFRGSPAARALSQASASPARSSPPVDKHHMTGPRRARPRRQTGRRNRPRAPNPPDDKGLPSHPIQQQGGALKPTTTALAQATLPCRLTVSSPTTHHLTTPPPPSLIPHSPRVDIGVYTLSSGGGGAHPFRECGPTPPQWKRTRRKRRPLRVCRRHGPRAPEHADSLLLGRRHRPRAPNQSTGNGWA